MREDIQIIPRLYLSLCLTEFQIRDPEMRILYLFKNLYPLQYFNNAY